MQPWQPSHAGIKYSAADLTCSKGKPGDKVIEHDETLLVLHSLAQPIIALLSMV